MMTTSLKRPTRDSTNAAYNQPRGYTSGIRYVTSALPEANASGALA